MVFYYKLFCKPFLPLITFFLVMRDTIKAWNIFLLCSYQENSMI